MGKELKTNAMRFLDKSKIEYTVQTYECEEFIDGIHTAEKLGQPLDETFKTLVAQGKSGSYYCFLLPVALELDLKKAAKSVGEKSVQLLHVKDITKITGYVRGGCTPIGMKKQFRTVIDVSAADKETIMFSAGKIGQQIETSPEELAKALDFEYAEITSEEK